MENVLVCITSQSNSRRLIDKSAEEAAAVNGALHILNINAGNCVFLNESSAELLDGLFRYGVQKGGIVHALAGDDIPGMILAFIKKHKITKIIIGEPSKDTAQAQKAGICEELLKRLKRFKSIEIIVVEREN